jgi:hypothetical protein
VSNLDTLPEWCVVGGKAAILYGHGVSVVVVEKITKTLVFAGKSRFSRVRGLRLVGGGTYNTTRLVALDSPEAVLRIEREKRRWLGQVLEKAGDEYARALNPDEVREKAAALRAVLLDVLSKLPSQS